LIDLDLMRSVDWFDKVMNDGVESLSWKSCLLAAMALAFDMTAAAAGKLTIWLSPSFSYA
jgi:hypothetical protein